jgi:integrase
MTIHHVHVVLSAALATATRQNIVAISPMTKTQTKPKKGDPNPGVILDEAQLGKLVAGCRGMRAFPIIALAAATGMRRNELLALRWSDFDEERKTRLSFLFSLIFCRLPCRNLN